MIVENWSTNGYLLTVVGCEGSTNQIMVLPGGKAEVPAAILTSGRYVEESSLMRGYVLVGDGNTNSPTGQWDMYVWQWPLLFYFVTGFSLAAAFMFIRAIVAMARAGFSGRDKLEVE